MNFSEPVPGLKTALIKPSGTKISRSGRGTKTGGGIRGVVSGWSRGASKRHEEWLQSIDTERLHAEWHLYGITLTVREAPKLAVDWRQLRQRWVRKIKRFFGWKSQDFIMCYVTEVTKRGIPHYHLTLGTPTELCPLHQKQIIEFWVQIASDYGTTLAAQCIKPVTSAAGWSRYLAKHSARSVYHYQRNVRVAGWKSTGRLWGKIGPWPVASARFIFDSKGYVQLRRFLRAYGRSIIKTRYTEQSQTKKVLASYDSYLAKTNGDGSNWWISSKTVQRMVENIARTSEVRNYDVELDCVAEAYGLNRLGLQPKHVRKLSKRVLDRRISWGLSYLSAPIGSKETRPLDAGPASRPLPARRTEVEIMLEALIVESLNTNAQDLKALAALWQNTA